MNCRIQRLVIAACVAPLLTAGLSGCTTDSNNGGAEGGDATSAESDTDGTGDSDGNGSGDADTGDGDDGGTVDYDCSGLQEGLSTLDINGTTRELYLDLPSNVDTGGPWPVIFNWHGLGDTAANMRGLVSPYVDDPTFPFIGVTPEDTDYPLTVPLLGTQVFDWDVFNVSDGSIEADLFDGVVACLDERYGVDRDRIHSMGFSLGSILSDMLGTIRGEQIASIATYSGGYWSNPQNVSGLLSEVVSWPLHLTDNKYPQLFIHGGPTDTFGVAGVVQLEFSIYAVQDVDFLNTKGHDAILCEHAGGHTVPSSMNAGTLIEFFRDHPRGTVDSPYANGLPASYSTGCSFFAKQ